MSASILGGIIAFSALISFSAVAQERSPEVPSTRVDDVVVNGQNLSATVNQFVDDIIAAPVGRGPARWHRNVCVGVLNLRRDAAQVIADRVALIAEDVGLTPGQPGCRPNILIMATDDGPGLARAIVGSQRRVFRPGYAGGAKSVRAIDAFESTTEPVRWWHMSMPVTETGAPAVKLPGDIAGPWVEQDGSRLTTRLRNNLIGAIVILDVSRVSGASFQQVGDYIGMVAMAQIDPDAETSPYDTVLNLFDPALRPAGLTDWDRSYLTSLYAAELNQRQPNAQSGAVASVMFRDRLAARNRETGSIPTPASE